jgi:hypothetical protein
MLFGKQDYFCPNCGTHQYSTKIATSSITVLCCDSECIIQFQRKYARSILGKDNLCEPKYKVSCLCNGVGCNSCEPQGRG